MTTAAIVTMTVSISCILVMFGYCLTKVLTGPTGPQDDD